jgi:putative DNA primase/helicase
VRFSTWGPKVIALIGALSGTQEDRSLVINMRRKLPGEQVQRLPLDLEDDCIDIRQKCQRWADDNKTALSLARPDVPVTGNDREQDNWGPLFSIAQCVNGDWLDKATKALLGVARETDDGDSITVKLLSDIQEIFKTFSTDKLSSEKLVENLTGLKDSPWCDWGRGRGLSQNALGRQLKNFKIKPFQFRLAGEIVRGYSLKQFQDSFKRYLSFPAPPIPSVTPLQPSNCAGFPGFQSGTEKKAVPVEKPRKAIAGLGCNSVTVENGVSGEEEKNNSLWEDFS